VTGAMNVLKPPGMTSHDVVDFVRGLVPRRVKVGHAGTLDPAAAGVLVLCTGAATRLIEYIVSSEKAYRAEVSLGVATDSLDVDGTVVEEADASGVTEAEARRALGALVGPQMMVPPMHSAARVDGKRLYDLARKGQEVEREGRPVTVHSAELVAFAPGPRATALADIRCSKGTYVRTLAEQLGERLGVCAHLSFLVRTAVGAQTLEAATALEELQEAHEAGRLEEEMVPLASALGHLPEVRLSERDAATFRQGSQAACVVPTTGLARVHDSSGELLGIGEVADAECGRVLQPRKVLAAS